MTVKPKHDVAKVGVAAVILKGDRVLLGKRTGAHGAGEWAFPGGKVDWGEDPAATALREIGEECGVSVDEGSLVGSTTGLMRHVRRWVARHADRALVKLIFGRLLRPGLEELGWTNDVFPEDGLHFVTIYFRARWTGGEPQILEPHKCLEWRWFPVNELPVPRFQGIDNLIDKRGSLER